MTNIYKVAKQAGVSITTVSHVFSGKRPVAAETRERVMEVVRQLNYQPTLAAQGLATGRTMILGIHFPFDGDLLISNPFFPELFEGLSVAAARFGYGFLLIPRTNEKENYIQKDLLNRLDGAIIVDPTLDDKHLKTILDHKFQIVTIGRHLGRRKFPWVDADYQVGFSQLFQHFSKNNYKRPALITTKLKMSYIDDIEFAFNKEAKALKLNSRIIKPSDLSDNKAYETALKLFESKERPDAIVAATDHQAIAVLHAAKDKNIRVPEEICVVGAGDTVLSSRAIPTLTSIDVEPSLLGEAAVELLLEMLNGSEPSNERLIPTKLIKRESTQRAR